MDKLIAFGGRRNVRLTSSCGIDCLHRVKRCQLTQSSFEVTSTGERKKERKNTVWLLRTYFVALPYTSEKLAKDTIK